MKKYLFLFCCLFVLNFIQDGLNAQSCTGSATMNVTIAPALSITGTVVNVGCGGSLGSITTSTTGSTMPYSYIWSNAATTANISSLAAGNYIVTVTGANGCSKSQSFTVTTTSGGAINVTGTITNAGCGTGSIVAVASGGTAPYAYAWSNGANTATADNLAAGTYTVTATATGGCAGTKSFVVTTAVPEPVIGTATSTCNSITFNWTGPATGTYQVKYKSSTSSGAVVNSSSQTSHTFTGLTASTSYKVFVRYKCTSGPRSAWKSKSKSTIACLSPSDNNNSIVTSIIADPVLNVYPNPASDEVNITFNSDKLEVASLFVLNSLGQLISTNNIPTKGENFSLNTSHLTPGLYWVTVQQGDVSKTSKLVISR